MCWQTRSAKGTPKTWPLLGSSSTRNIRGRVSWRPFLVRISMKAKRCACSKPSQLSSPTKRFTDDPQPLEQLFASECLHVNAIHLNFCRRIIGGVLIAGGQRILAMWLRIALSDASHTAPPRGGFVTHTGFECQSDAASPLFRSDSKRKYRASVLSHVTMCSCTAGAEETC